MGVHKLSNFHHRSDGLCFLLLVFVLVVNKILSHRAHLALQSGKERAVDFGSDVTKIVLRVLYQDIAAHGDNALGQVNTNRHVVLHHSS